VPVVQRRPEERLRHAKTILVVAPLRPPPRTCSQDGAAPAPQWRGAGAADRVVGLTPMVNPLRAPSLYRLTERRNLRRGDECVRTPSSRRNEGTSSAASGTSNGVEAGTGEEGTGTSAPVVAPSLRRRRAAPKPAAITVTRTSSPMASSITAPKMTLAF